ncbi:MAG: PEFG-CTERM sorting domain-containing protein [Nitrosopumilaceae archaeon]|jgi:predicted secreted protein with PEFG-CTERM motif
MKICVLVIFDKLKHHDRNMKKLLFFVPLFLLLIPFPSVHAEHIFEDRMAFAQYLDTIKTTGKSYTIEVDDNTFDIYYGGYGSIEIGGEALETDEPTLSSMNLNVERKSLEITLNPVDNDKVFWVLLPLEVISAEGAKYQLFIDGVETNYDLTLFPENYALGMILPPGAENVEIMGTQVIPEFGTVAILVMGVAITGIVFVARKSPFGANWTRIN